MKFFATALAIIASSALVMTAPSTQANTHQLSRRDTGKCNGTSCKTGLFDNFECKTGSCTQPSAGDGTPCHVDYTAEKVGGYYTAHCPVL